MSSQSLPESTSKSVTYVTECGHPITRAECAHEPLCPSAKGPDRDAAHVVACHPEQGWSLLCNGVVLFDDTGEILPDGSCVHARRADLTAAALHRVA